MNTNSRIKDTQVEKIKGDVLRKQYRYGRCQFEGPLEHFAIRSDMYF